MSHSRPNRGDDEHSQVSSIILYSHDGFGLGHLKRSVRIAEELHRRAPESSVLIVTSSPAAGRPFIPEEFEFLKLPSVTKTGTERYRPNLKTDLRTVIALRSALLLATVQHLQPDVFVVDHRPLGLKNELLPTLEWIRDHAPHTRTAVGLRDVIDESETVRRAWEVERIYDVLETLYDLILVYGEPSIVDITQEYAFPGSLAFKARFTGYFGSGAPRRTREDVRRSIGLRSQRLVVVHVGGGGDGSKLVNAYLDSIHLLPEDIHSVIITGPLMPLAERNSFRSKAEGERVSFAEFQDDLPSVIAAADLSVSMAGYNTMCEVLTAKVRALVVPRIFPRQEQYIRAQRMSERGLIHVLLPTALNPNSLAEQIERCLAETPRSGQPLVMLGVERTAEWLLEMVPSSGESARTYVSAGNE